MNLKKMEGARNIRPLYRFVGPVMDIFILFRSITSYLFIIKIKKIKGDNLATHFIKLG
jgi:hypothetical protein